MKTPRGYAATLVDRLASWQLGYPAETCSYTVTDVRIPVSNGSEDFELAADLYQPVLSNDEQSAGTILIRSPYGRGLPISVIVRPYAARGYQCLFVSCRGTFGSGSTFFPWRDEERDGHAIVEWMRKQDWYTGSFATMGGSYLGFVQWALLRDPPSDMIAAVIQCAPHDFSKQLWGTGSFAMEVINWAERVAHQEETGFWAFWERWNTAKRIRQVLDAVPLAENVKKYFNGSAPWLEFAVDHPDTSDSHYEPWKCGEALERVDIPILLAGGWYDLFEPQTMEQYRRLSERNANVTLLMGPWNHMQMSTDSKVHRDSFDWLGEHLTGRKKSIARAGVEYFVTGAQEWRKAEKWPPATTHQTLYLQANSKLDSQEPAAEEISTSFAFDPKQPTPTMGGNLLFGGGSADDTILAARSDVITFTTQPLEQNVEVTGKITVELNHSSDNPTVDLFVRISEVNATGRSHNITETYKRLEPARRGSSVVLQLNDCAHRFLKETQIRLIIAGASHPQYTSIPEGAVHTIRHGKDSVSKIMLPVAS